MDDRFIAIVRRHLPLLAATEDLSPEAPLSDLGLDSMATVGLVVELENELGVRLPEHSLTPATFADVATLWGVVRHSTRS